MATDAHPLELHMYDYRPEVIAEANAALRRGGLPTYSEMAKALQRYVDCDRCRDVPGDTPAAQALPLLERIPKP